MKKFLSICLVALCSVSAMYAQTASTDSRTGVACGTPVTVEATSKTGFYHFVEWKIQNGTTPLVTVAKDGTTNSQYGESVSTSVDTQSGVETSTLTLNPLSSALIDAATSGTVTFEAFFEIDSYTINGTVDGTGTVTGSGNTTGDTPVTLEATANNACTRFDHWEDAEGNIVPGNSGEPNKLTVTPLATWEHNSTHEYKAVFVTKTINIVVTTSDNSKGTVTIVAPAGE